MNLRDPLALPDRATDDDAELVYEPTEDEEIAEPMEHEVEKCRGL